MTRVINIRLKLSDFIDTDLEKTIMDRIKKIENDLHVKIIINFWIDDSNVNIKSFYDRWKDSLSVKTVIKNGEDLKANEHIFLCASAFSFCNSRVCKRSLAAISSSLTMPSPSASYLAYSESGSKRFAFNLLLPLFYPFLCNYGHNDL